MSLNKADRPADVKAAISARARDAATAAIPQARRAGNTAVRGVMQGMESARGWAAPRLDQAADAFTGTVAPRVSSALHSTASRVAPEPAAKTGLRRLLDWRLLLGIGAALAAAGAAAAMTMRKRYQEATLAASEDAEVASDLDKNAAAESDGMRSDVNGRVSSTRK